MYRSSTIIPFHDIGSHATGWENKFKSVNLPVCAHIRLKSQALRRQEGSGGFRTFWIPTVLDGIGGVGSEGECRDSAEGMVFDKRKSVLSRSIKAAMIMVS
jgi:hypothetical protein